MFENCVCSGWKYLFNDNQKFKTKYRYLFLAMIDKKIKSI